jgi:hypothetical protein
MATDLSFSWVWLFGLGALHGLNPGMGWLFAVALGLQERSARAVWRALLPLGAGHALAIAAAVVPAALIGLVLPVAALKWLVAAALLAFALYRIWRPRHLHFGGMRVGLRDLTLWSLLMASAHGAGLMVLPLLLPEQDAVVVIHAAAPAAGVAGAGLRGHHDHHAGLVNAPRRDAVEKATGRLPSVDGATYGEVSRVTALSATFVHTAGYLVVTGLLAFVVYAWAGLRLLRAAWINLDLIWAGALAATAFITPFL